MIAMGDASLRMFSESPVVVGGESDLLWEVGRWGSTRLDVRRQLLKVKQRHLNKYNVVFCDGHVESIQRRILFSTAEDALRRWNNDHEAHMQPGTKMLYLDE
jgi:prepilin-type processing-associated H-X9-DG protein